jgi:hypothetical protein
VGSGEAPERLARFFSLSLAFLLNILLQLKEYLLREFEVYNV